MLEHEAIRDLSDIECGQVYGGIVFHPEPGPSEPPQPVPPIVFKGPITPQPGPIPYLGPNPGPFSVG
jgi:hypothetical protein